MKKIFLLDIRDKALFSVLIYGWARVSAVVALKVQDYYQRKGERWLRLNEKRGKIHEVPVHSKARESVDQWLLASGRFVASAYDGPCKVRSAVYPGGDETRERNKHI
jgi:integrase